MTRKIGSRWQYRVLWNLTKFRAILTKRFNPKMSRLLELNIYLTLLVFAAERN